MGKKTDIRRMVPILTGGLLAVLLFCSVMAYAKYSVDTIQNQYKIRLEETGQQLAREVKLHVDASRSVTEVLAQGFANMDDLHSEEALAVLEKVSQKTDFTRMWLTKADGRAISSERSTSEATGREYFASALRGESGISKVQISRVNGEKNVVIYSPVIKDQKVTGMVIGIYKLEGLADTIHIECFGGQGFSQIFSADGELMVNSSEGSIDDADTNLLNVWAGEKLKPDMEKIKESLKNGEAELITYSSGAYDRYGYFCPIGINDWFVFVTMPNELIESATREQLTAAALLCLEFVFAIIIALLWYHRKKSRDLRLLAEKDLLTGLYNRGTLEKEIDQRLKNGEGSKCALVMFDIDKFKQVNDTRGHMAGDRILKFVAEMMCREFCSGEILGRLGGDEFAIFTEQAADCESVHTKAADFAGKLRCKIGDQDEMAEILLSIGIAYAPQDGTSFRGLYQVADDRMYQGKRRGGDSVV